MLHQFSLDPSSKKHQCPQCKQKTFVVYLDNESKLAVDPYQFGRCDRENSCGYHMGPWQDPEFKPKKDFVPPPEPVVEQIYPTEQDVNRITNRTRTCISPFHKFCNKLGIPNDHLVKVGVYSEEDGRTVYLFRDEQQRVTNFKWFKYKEDGHRDKAFDSYSLRNPKISNPPHTPPIQKEASGGQNGSGVEKKYKLCLFGAHLLSPLQGAGGESRIVCVVESEKSMAMASFFYPQYDWVSCGSNNGLSDGSNRTSDKISALKGRKVYWVGDCDKASRMRYEFENGEKKLKPSSIRNLMLHNIEFEIVDLFPDRTDGYDIGDAISDGLRPEIKPTEKPTPAGIAKVESSDTIDYDLPDGVNFETVKEDIRTYMHFDHAGRIYIVRKKKGGGQEQDSRGFGVYYCSPISNFTINGLGLIKSELESDRLVEINNIHGRCEVVKVPTKAFASPTEFTCFIEAVGNFQYDGVGTDLKKIRAKLYDTMLTFDEIENLGWHHTGYFLFANGAYGGNAEKKFFPIDKFGFVRLGDRNFFIQPLSIIHREESEEWQDEKKFIFREREDVKLKDWSDLFCRVHKDNGRIALAWYITSLFRDFIYQRFKFFPHLFLFGPPGTGKSQVGWSIRATGYVGLVKPFNLNTGTAVAFHREFSHFRNFPAWCDEYDNSIPYERIQALKASYDGVGHKKSVKDSDKRTKSTQVNRAIMISGQQLPIADNALFKRVVLLQFNQTEYTDAEKRMYADLQNMEEGGLTHITAGFMHFRKEMETEYLTAFDLVLDDVMKCATKLEFEVEDRIARNSAIILTTIKVMEKKLGDRLPYTYEQLRDTIMVNMKNQMGLISNANETNTFWDMVEFLVREGKIKESEDFTFDCVKTVKVYYNRQDVMKELPQTTDVVFVRFSKIIPLYKEAFKRQNSSTASPMDKSSLTHYLQHSKPFIGMVSQVNFKDSRTSAYCFDYGMLKAMGVNLNVAHQQPPPLGGGSGGPTRDPPFGAHTGNPDDLPF